VGIIRGEELLTCWQQNPTLKLAGDAGMRFRFITRETYRSRTDPGFQDQLEEEFDGYYILPEGGTNPLAVKGCEEILEEADKSYDFVCCSVGTGGTLAGISNAAGPAQKVLGFPALKGEFLKKDIRSFAGRDNWELILGYHFGGYARVNGQLIRFINEFREITGIPLDPVYTGKMLFGIMDLVNRGYFKPTSRILAIHTGGLQGVTGMNQRLKAKKLPLINI
jgi:1-aminocyclopropane-1-carboxylate deaminase